VNSPDWKVISSILAGWGLGLGVAVGTSVAGTTSGTGVLEGETGVGRGEQAAASRNPSKTERCIVAAMGVFPS
jgi:hypothetical protein